MPPVAPFAVKFKSPDPVIRQTILISTPLRSGGSPTGINNAQSSPPWAVPCTSRSFPIGDGGLHPGWPGGPSDIGGVDGPVFVGEASVVP
jgi:hypothetical protein